MTSKRRLSVCYLVPGHDLLTSVGPTRNVVSLARALEQWADVTVAFRRVADKQRPEGLRVLEIEPGESVAGTDDAAMRGIGLRDFYRFMRALHGFVHHELAGFDVVLEKSWLLSGYVSALCRRRGQLGIPVENIVQNPAHAAGGRLMKRLRLEVARRVAARAMQGAPLVIAETEFLKREIAAHWGVAADRIAVVDLGVDRRLFRPLDQAAARDRLGIARDSTVLTYVGVLDRTHDLEPALRAMVSGRPAATELHVVGDGVRRAELGALGSAAGTSIVFHGRVPHAEVPHYIAAADLCLAPYDAAAFSSGELGYSTMKIPEYLAVGRPVVSVPSGRIRALVRDGETGFLFGNEPEEWQRFLSTLPSRERLRKMGDAAAATELTSWEDTALGYLALCERALAASPRSRET